MGKVFLTSENFKENWAFITKLRVAKRAISFSKYQLRKATLE